MARLSQSVGAAFESILEQHHDVALQQGRIAWIHHTQAVTKIIKGRLQYIGKGAADYSAVAAVGAKAIAIEAKSTDGERLARSEIKALQVKHLDAVDSVGGIALLAVEFRLDRPHRFAIPWRDVPWKLARTAYSITLSDMKPEWAFESDCYLAKFCASAGVFFAPKRVYARE